ncbi:hypothetical protein CYMTET_23771 [Cymbomonas tetramitiformis]|uniref:Uncharacterized protein n=1 Tax=Cymbomonas tetramitiformis TaxID=36881 RepID=A0AAE0FXA5_9CHLO|nr:hypothetical protein CYMTET_23771 [Cymbomonas tetramitiformis]
MLREIYLGISTTADVAEEDSDVVRGAKEETVQQNMVLSFSASRHASLLLFLACFQCIASADMTACQSELSVYMNQFTTMESAIEMVTQPEFANSVCQACGIEDLDNIYGKAAPLMEYAGCNKTSVDDIINLLEAVVKFACSTNSAGDSCAASIAAGLDGLGVNLPELVESGTFDTSSLDIGSICSSLSGMGCCWPSAVDLITALFDAMCGDVSELSTYNGLLSVACNGWFYPKVDRLHGRESGLGLRQRKLSNLYLPVATRSEVCAGYTTPEVTKCSIDTENLHGVDCDVVQQVRSASAASV